MTKKDCYDICLENKRNSLLMKTSARDKALARLESENARFAEIKRLMLDFGAKTALTAISGNSKKLDELKDTLFCLNQEREQILKKAGIKEIEFECDKCCDTGFVEGKLCDCIKKSAIELYIKELSRLVPIGECRFENFDLNYYSDVETDAGNPKKRMTEILKLAREYSLKFDPSNASSLLFMGNTGLGKTHISLAIAYDLIMRGFDVIYGSAYNLFAKMEGEHFGDHSDKSYNEAVGCDLLIIDDLGGEFVSPYIQSLVYNIVNTRLLARKPTIINTNLSMADINRVYTPRVASRLLGEYTAKRFLGNDIRQKRKERK